ncbi:SDR family oxidoreductase [Corticibacter populi]|uniref:SDR family oxidoreductase n=1 Tax=Corticibacter populi TaxID=1550736 RepID=A0A3M6QYA4_9BURK|nr:SDR family NAD(P)-dependent oxidoreductase [Corticibacter populi]RMX07599.1 SDR family oxidoreductase [Corticibacter populi]RZS30097.1 3-oxoacyl-[acyl-carrier protein] reductase [Corticibacter populi]
MSNNVVNAVNGAGAAHVAIVTGAAQGLGQVIAEHLHAAGYRVAIADINLDAARALASRLDASGTTALALKLDVREKADFEAARDSLLASWGGVQVMVNNAAVTLHTPVMQISPEEFSSVVDTNLRGTFLGCQVFGSHFGANGYGRIVNLASLAGQNGGTAAGAHYASSKAGILVLTKIFAKELAGHGVTVNAIAPGPIDLPAVRASVPPGKLQGIIDNVIPVHQLGDPGFIADTVVHLASPQAGFVTGAAWDINGGIFMR